VILVRRGLPAGLVLAAYLMIGLAAFWSALPTLSTHALGAEGDFLQAIWYIGWVPHALEHGLNPFWTNSLNVPYGINLAQNTLMPLVGLVATPVTIAFGPLIAANVLLVLAMPLSAASAFLVLRRWQVWLPAAAIGGLMYGFSPYMVGQSEGHPQVSLQVLPPLIALVTVNIVRGRGNPIRQGVGLGVLLAADYLISQELTAIVGLFLVAALVCAGLRRSSLVRQMGSTHGRSVGVALAVGAVLLAYPVWLLLAGPQHVTGPPIGNINPFHNDLLSFVVPGPLQRVSLGLTSLQTQVLAASNPTEAGGYIGIPLLLLVGILVWRCRHDPRVQLATVLTAGAAVLSLGPHLAVDGQLLRVPLPFAVFDRFPFLEDILPSRVNFAMDACLAALTAFGLDDIRRGVPGRSRGSPPAEEAAVQSRRGLVAAGVVLAALVLTQLPAWPYQALPQPVLPPSLAHAMPGGDPVVATYPYEIYNTAGQVEPMSWQSSDGYSFRIFGGYAYIPGVHGRPTLLAKPMDPSGLQEFLAAQAGVFVYGPRLSVSLDLVATTRATIAAYDIRAVIVDRSRSGSGQVVQLFDDTLGPPVVASGTLVMWAGWTGSAGT
jgi:hypothetical protein